MKKRLANINPLQCGIVLAVLYACLSLIFIPFLLLGFLLPAASGVHRDSFGMSLIFIILFPIIYGILGFIAGVLAALIYNLTAKMTGGLEFTTVDVAPGLPPAINYPAH